MATKVHMEALSPTMEEGQVVKWLKAEGDTVASGDVLAEVETDKATMELVARGDGILRKILSGEGQAVPVGEVIAVIGAADEDIDALVAGAGSGGGSAAATPAESPAATPTAGGATEDGGASQEESTPAAPASSTDGGKVKASPVARRLAAEKGVDLSSIAGSGPGGRIVKRDVESAQAGSSAPRKAAVQRPETEFVDIPLTQIRKTIARRLTESIGPVPHFFLTIDVDMTRVMDSRKRVNALLEERGQKASINDFVVKATAAALVAHPECNAWWQGDSIRQFNSVHIGIAVAVPDGLITPVVRDAQTKGIGEIGAEIREMAGRAQEKKLKPEEYTGSTFSISNLGMFGIEEFTAVINPPEAGILAVGGVEQRPVVVDGAVVVQPRMKVTMSCDHRVIDGAAGARFLATLKRFLEEPAVILA